LFFYLACYLIFPKKRAKTAIKSENSPVDVPSVPTLRFNVNSNLWDLQNNYELKILESQIIVMFLSGHFNYNNIKSKPLRV